VGPETESPQQADASRLHRTDAGRPLDLVTRLQMEQRFAYDFSHVRVHTNQAAHSSAHRLGARAYTVGSEIVFGADQVLRATSIELRTRAPGQPGGQAGVPEVGFILHLDLTKLPRIGPALR